MCRSMYIIARYIFSCAKERNFIESDKTFLCGVGSFLIRCTNHIGLIIYVDFIGYHINKPYFCINHFYLKGMIKFNAQFQSKLEDVFEENGYKVRYEKGNFKSGFCIIEDRKLIVLNKFAVLEARINSMVEIMRQLSNQELLQGEKFEQIKPLLAQQQTLQVA